MLPIFEEIILDKEPRDKWPQIIKELLDKEVPRLINLQNIEDQEMIVSMIEKIITKYQINQFPYPTYLISDLINYKGSLSNFNHKKFIPKFFNKKQKNLNIKESDLNSRANMKKNKVLSINFNESLDNINTFRDGQYQIKRLVEQNNFLEDICSDLGLFDD